MADANAPDLYVPLMSFITFVLVTGYARGSAAALNDGVVTFSPEVRRTKEGRWGVRQNLLEVATASQLLLSPLFPPWGWSQA